MADFGQFRGFGDKLFQGQLPTKLGLIGSIDVNPLILDDYPNAAAAYSLRKLRSAYTGSAIRVRRSSDNTEQDIGFVNNQLDVSDLQSFCSGTGGFVTTWYDQSGNGYNATQTTAANQPQIVSSGSVILENTKPALQFDGSNDFLLSTIGDYRFLHDIYFVTKVSTNQPNYRSYFGMSGAGFGNILWHIGSSTGSKLGITQPGFNIISGGVDNLNQKLLNAYATSSLLNFNDVSNGNSISGTMLNISGTVSNLSIGGSGNSSNIIGDFLSTKNQEFIIYNSNQSSNRSAINNNINSYYAVY